MWKLLAAVLVPIASLLWGWLKGRSSGKEKAEAKARVAVADATSEANKAKASAAAEVAKNTAVHAAITLATQVAASKAESQEYAESVEQEIQTASDTGDIDALIAIAGSRKNVPTSLPGTWRQDNESVDGHHAGTAAHRLHDHQCGASSGT